jgi:hypothetical protein
LGFGAGEKSGVAERFGFGAGRAYRAEIDIAVAATAGVIEGGGRRAAGFAEPLSAGKRALLGAGRNDALAERATAAQEVPEDLAEGDLFLLVEEPTLFEAGANLANEAGFLSARLTAVGTSGGGGGTIAIRAGGGIFRGFRGARGKGETLEDEGEHASSLVPDG